jgi:predicted O-methyltransferase YrrM
MPISPQGGDLLYILVRARRPNTVIEFGMSYGISTNLSGCCSRG